MPIQQSFVLNPVTAIQPYTFYTSDEDGENAKELTVNLVGEGSYLKIYDARTSALLGVRKVFESQQIHGISIHNIHVVGWSDILLWGGRSYTFLKDEDIDGIIKGNTESLDKYGDGERLAPDWILDGAFSDDEAMLSCVFITAHSAAFYVRLCGNVTTQLVPSESGSILYSAQVLWTGWDSIVVAAGTVFGDIEIISWKLKYESEEETGGGRVAQTFRGHEGSIFGVAFSNEFVDHTTGLTTRLLGSCSDDRTIRLWDLSSANLYLGGLYGKICRPMPKKDNAQTGLDVAGSPMATISTEPVTDVTTEVANQLRETGFGSIINTAGLAKHCLGKVMGHASRIWKVDFMMAYDSAGDVHLNVLSFGEDCTVQQWILEPMSLRAETAESTAACAYEFKHARTYAHHTGKHIWSYALGRMSGKQYCMYGREGSGGNYSLLTGGADGAIVKFNVKLQTKLLDTESTLYDLLPPQIRSDDGLVVFENPDQPQVQINENHCLNYSTDQLLGQFTKTIEPAPIEQAKGMIEEPVEDQGSNTVAAATDEQKKKKKRKKAKKLPTAKKDAFNKYAFAGSSLLFTTAFGKVMVQATQEAEFTEVARRDKFSGLSYSVTEPASPRKDEWSEAILPEGSEEALVSYSVTASVGKSSVFLAGSKGHIFLYRRGLPILLVANVEHKVAGLFYLPLFMDGHMSILATTLGQTQAIVLAFSRNDPTEFTRLEIELPAGFVVTGAGVSLGRLILGSRNGSMAVFDPKGRKESLSLVVDRSFVCKDAITAIVPTPVNMDGSPHIVVTARNGRYAIFEVQTTLKPETPIGLKLVHYSMLPFGPMIETAMFSGKSLIICGFRSENFIVWNETEQRELMSVKCGGAHRNFAYRPPSKDKRGGIFAYTKASELYIHEQLKNPYRKFKEGGHGREMKAAAVSSDQQLIATAAEDTNIRIWSYAEQHDPVKNRLDCHAVLRKHSAGVQHLQWAEAAGDQKYLFSAGGYEEFMVWSITQIPGFGLGAVCEASLDDLSEERDLRIMSFHAVAVGGGEGEESTYMIAIAFSDSTIRAYFYSRSGGFEKLAKGRYTSSCLLQIQILPMPTGETLILTGCTDGYLQLWSIGDEEDAEGVVELVLKQRVQAHQSSILSFDVLPVGPTDFIIATGGDDNAVALTLLGEQGFGMRMSLPSAHAAAVTGLTFVAHSHNTAENAGTFRFCTVGGDQVVKKFTVAIKAEMDESGLHIKEMKWQELDEGDDFNSGDIARTTVSDAAGIVTFGGHCSHKQCMVYGNGLEIFEV